MITYTNTVFRQKGNLTRKWRTRFCADKKNSDCICTTCLIMKDIIDKYTLTGLKSIVDKLPKLGQVGNRKNVT